MGGEITWKCLANGQFKFTMKVYRDCNGVQFTAPVQMDVHNYPGLTQIQMNLVTQTDISSTGAAGSSADNCPTCVNPGTVGGAVEEFILESNPITLTGVPPANGWIFSFSSCCRNAAITNLSGAGGLGFTLRAIMYSYNGLNTNPCYDSSPAFAEIPNSIICNGYPFEYNHNAIDPELDSLVYSFGKPLDSWSSGAWSNTNPTACPFSAGYSFASPLPGPAQNPLNVAATVDSSTGVIAFTSYTAGNFVTVTKCEAYKCGILVAEIYREIQVALLNCKPILGTGVKNFPPVVTKPFQNPNRGVFSESADTIYAGAIVDFFLSATDFDFVPNVNGGLQTLTLEATGSEFGAGFVNPLVGCLIPPCATLTPPPPATAVAGTGTTFHWETTCDHLGFQNGCVNFSNTYNFVIRVKDNFCPANGITFSTISVTILAPPIMQQPDLRCVSVQSNGDVQLSWSTPVDTFDTFDAFLIYHASAPNGPYTLIDSIKVLAQNTYMHVGANGQATPNYYYIQTRSFCNNVKFSPPSDTVASILLTAANGGDGLATLAWNPIHNPLFSSSSLYYQIFLEYPPGTWTKIDSTNLTTYTDTVNISVCSDSLNYRVEISDSTGCVSVSSIDGATFQNFAQPDAPSLRCLAIDNMNGVTLSWIAPVDTGLSFDGYFIYSSITQGGPYTVIDSIKNYALTSYTHTLANINLNPRFYYVRAYSLCGNSFSLSSDTLQAIRLTVVAAGSNASLTWNALHTPMLSTSFSQYYIYKEFPLGTWNLLDSTANLSYIAPLNLCNDSVNFRIELGDVSGCISKSNVAGQRFVDNTIPDSPGLRCVIVNPNGSVTMNWVADPDTGLDFNSYHIYQSNNAAGPYTVIDSIFNYNTLTYTHTTTNAYVANQFYYIESRTGCGVKYSPGSDTLQAMRLTVANPLGNVANLSWNAIHVPNLPTSTGVYNIYKEFPIGTWNLLTNTANTSYIDSNIVCRDSINYRIEIADASGCKSISTVAGDWFIDNTVPDSPELRCITVNPNGSVSLNWIADADTGLDYNSYHLYHSNNAVGPYTVIDSIFNYGTLAYTHATANAYPNNEFYYIKTRTGCGVKYSAGSDTLQAMRLNLNNIGGVIADLTWNPIHTPNLPTSTGIYNVYKEYPIGNVFLRATTPNTNYSDTNIVCNDSIAYYITIGDASGCESVSTKKGDHFIDNSVPLAPIAKCVAVATNGDVTVNWIAPIDTGLQFNSYHVYFSNNAGGPYNVIDSIFNYNQTSYTHVGVNANLNNAYYYIKTRTGCGVQYSLPSDSVRAIKLNVSNTGTGVAYLQWNAIHDPLFTSSSLYYTIYREYPTNTWTKLDSTIALTYLDTINLCNAIINYRIEIRDSSGCVSVSNIDGDVFQDVTPPAITELDTVSVIPLNGQVNVSWFVNTSGDTKGYIIYLYNGSSWDSIGAVAGINTLSWLHTTSNANVLSQLYAIAAYDSCGNLSPIGIGHNTIFLQDSLDKCNAAIKLKWNPYINMKGGVGQYKLYMSENNAAYTLLVTLPNTETEYLHTNIKKDTLYCYFIRAVGTVVSRTATSNKTCELADVIIFPKYTYLKHATVIDNDVVGVTAYVDTAADVSSYKLMRSLDPNSNYDVAQIIPAGATTNISFVDYDVTTSRYSYYYRVIPVSTCGKDMDTSNIGRTILAQGTPNDNLTNTVFWNRYEDWSGGVDFYHIYRSIDGVLNNTPIVTVPSSVTSYIDDVAKYYTGTGEFCYYIQAQEDNGNVFGFLEKSESNEICLVQEPHVYIPNGFTPGGKNPVFMPTGSFIGKDDYYFAVFNRWGQPVFETTDYTQGWNGTLDGEEAPQGIYVYVAKITGTSGTKLSAGELYRC
nr:gliding motility-associated C-terminal domain-containing protein [Bacteroidota bacterium]